MERASSNLANALQDAGYRVTYLSIFKSKRFFSLNNNINFIEPINFNESKLSIIKTIIYLRNSAKKINADHYISFNKLYSSLVLIAFTGLNKKIIISERSSPLYKWPTLVALFMDLIYTFWKPRGIIAQTSIAAKYQKKYYGNNVPIKVIPNIIREVSFSPQTSRESIILAVGRINDHLKGFDRLIEAFNLVKNREWNLVFVGGDGKNTELEKLVAKYNLINRVMFVGPQTNVDFWYQKASIFVIPSRSEGFPNALAEAMASGVASIAFDFIAGPRDLIDHNVNGLIIEDGHIEKLAHAIDLLIEDTEKRNLLGEKAKDIKIKLSQNKIINDTIDFVFKYE